MADFFQDIRHSIIKINDVTIGRPINSTNNRWNTFVHDFTKTHSIWSSAVVNSWSSVYINFSDIKNDRPPPFLSPLVRPTWLYPTIPNASNLVGFSHVSEKPITEKSWLMLLMYDKKLFMLAGMLLISTCIIENSSFITLFLSVNLSKLSSI